MKKLYKFFKQGGIAFVILCMALLINHRLGFTTLLGLFLISYGFSMMSRSKFDMTSLIIIAYCFFYLFFSSLNGISYNLPTLLQYGVFPLIFYQYGKEVVKKWDSDNKHLLFWIIIIVCYCLDIFIVCGVNIVKTGELINIKREFSFGPDDTVGMAATLVGLCMDIAVLGLPMAFVVKARKFKVLFFLLFFCSFIVTIHLLNRTGLIVLLLCSIPIILLRSRKNIKFFFATLFFVALLFYAFYRFNIVTDELFELYDSRNKDLASMGDRSGRWTLALKNLFEYPFGWINNESNKATYFVHNMWLDIARISGIIPFSLLAYMAIDSFRNAFKLLKRNESPLSYMILGLNVCFFASCFVEPIFGGTHMMLYCMLWGTSTGLMNINYKAQ